MRGEREREGEGERERKREGVRERARERARERLITCVTALALLGGTELVDAELTYWRQYLYFVLVKQ